MRLLFKQRMFTWFDSYDIYTMMQGIPYIQWKESCPGDIVWLSIMQCGRKSEKYGRRYLPFFHAFACIWMEAVLALSRGNLRFLNQSITCPATTGKSKEISWHGIMMSSVSRMDASCMPVRKFFTSQIPMCWISDRMDTRCYHLWSFLPLMRQNARETGKNAQSACSSINKKVVRRHGSGAWMRDPSKGS